MPGYLHKANDWARSLAGGLVGARPRGTLPGALILGAQKAGTTSLFAFLAQHPGVSVSENKEVHFFDNAFGRGERWYRERFPDPKPGQVTIEASPYYLFHPLVPERAAGLVPSAKLIVLLREPVSRAFSHYQHEVESGRETLSFEDAVARESERLGDSAERLARGETERSFEHQNFSYVSRGFYAEQIERWLKQYPRSAMLILKAEDMFKAAQEAFDRVCAFLEIAAAPILDAEPRHKRDYEPLSPATREQLSSIFEEPNRRLAELTGISWDAR